MLSIPQAAERLGVSRQAVFKLVKNGKLPATQVGRAWIIEEKDVNERIERKEEGRPKAA